MYKINSIIIISRVPELVMIKKCVFYIAQYPVRLTAQSASHFLPSLTRPVHSDTNSAILGSILAVQQLRAMTIYSHFHHVLSMARYSFIQLSEQGCHGENENCQTSKW